MASFPQTLIDNPVAEAELNHQQRATDHQLDRRPFEYPSHVRNPCCFQVFTVAEQAIGAQQPALEHLYIPSCGSVGARDRSQRVGRVSRLAA